MSIKVYKCEFIIRPCPWCNKTPECDLPSLEMDGGWHKPWLWTLKCRNTSCTMQPTSSYVVVRKTSKYNLSKQIRLFEKLIGWWNTGNPRAPIDKTIVYFEIDEEKASYCATNFSQFLD